MLADALKTLLATSYAFVIKAQFFHWNVEGPDFPQYHDFFGSYYEEVYGNTIDKLAEIIALLPGMKSPTVLPLAEPGWSSVHSVLNENDFWEIIEQLKAAGAQGILVVPIEKMVI